MLYHYLVIGFSALLLVLSCNIPDVSDIHLSSCIRECNTDSQACFDKADAALADCAGESVCVALEIQAAQDCLNTTMNCVADCVEETENQLKN